MANGEPEKKPLSTEDAKQFFKALNVPTVPAGVGVDNKVSEELEQFSEKGPREAQKEVKQLTDQLSWREEIEKTSLTQDIQARKEYASKLFWLIVCWLIAILVIILMCGFKFTVWTFQKSGEYSDETRVFTLSDPVLMALIGGTTASVIGLFAIVIAYLFPNNKK